METGPDGDKHFEVETVTNERSNAKADNADFANGPVPPRARRDALPPRRAADPEQRLRNLEEQVDQLRREVERLRRPE